jgi:hypothetical protein
MPSEMKPSRSIASATSSISALSLPTRTLTAISQSDTTLMTMSLPGSSINARAWGPRRSSSASHHSKAWVSRRDFNRPRLAWPPARPAEAYRSPAPSEFCRVTLLPGDGSAVDTPADVYISATILSCEVIRRDVPDDPAEGSRSDCPGTCGPRRGAETRPSVVLIETKHPPMWA